MTSTTLVEAQERLAEARRLAFNMAETDVKHSLSYSGDTIDIGFVRNLVAINTAVSANLDVAVEDFLAALNAEFGTDFEVHSEADRAEIRERVDSIFTDYLNEPEEAA